MDIRLHKCLWVGRESVEENLWRSAEEDKRLRLKPGEHLSEPAREQSARHGVAQVGSAYREHS